MEDIIRELDFVSRICGNYGDGGNFLPHPLYFSIVLHNIIHPLSIPSLPYPQSSCTKTGKL
jgi:hypothetical protein